MGDRDFDVGGTLINDTAIHTGRWRKLVALTDIVLAAGTIAEDITGTLAGAELKANSELIATISAIKLTSGTAVAYF